MGSKDTWLNVVPVASPTLVLSIKRKSNQSYSDIAKTSNKFLLNPSTRCRWKP